MVLLFVGQGHGQHPATTYRDLESSLNPYLSFTGLSTLLAANLLLGRKIAGRPLLTVPTKTAYFCTRAGLASLAIAPITSYLFSAQENRRAPIDSSIFRYEQITPTPFQWWRKSEKFTFDDAWLAGGFGGLLSSYRMRSLGALSVANRLLGRLGAFSTGTLYAMILWVPWLNPSIRKQEAQVQYKRALALRKLNDDPKFNASLGTSLGDAFLCLTLQAETRGLASEALTDEQKAALSPAMAFSWLDRISYERILQGVAQALETGASLQHTCRIQFPERTSLADKKDRWIQEAQAIAVHIKPRSLLRARLMMEGSPKPLSANGDSAEVWRQILMTEYLAEIILQIAAVDKEGGKKVDKIHYWLSILDTEQGEHIVPSSGDFIRRWRDKLLEEQSKGTIARGRVTPALLSALNGLIKEFDEHAQRVKKAKLQESEQCADSVKEELLETKEIADH